MAPIKFTRTLLNLLCSLEPPGVLWGLQAFYEKVIMALPPTSKRPEREHKYSRLSSADIKDAWRNTSTLPYMIWYITQTLNPLDYYTYHQV